jgi:hypothetical protein
MFLNKIFLNRFIFFSILFFLLNLSLYIYNPYYLLRPQQIQIDNSLNRNIDKGNYVSVDDIPNVLISLLRIPNAPGDNFSVTRKSRLNYFLNGQGNCSQLSTGMGLVLDSLKIDYSIVHFIPKNGLLEGAGHSVLRYKGENSFLVDPLFNLVPIVDTNSNSRRTIDLNELIGESIHLMNLSFFKYLDGTEPSKYYTSEFILTFAEVDKEEMNEFFSQNDFLVDLFQLSEGKVTRLIINGIAAITFNLPTFSVDSLSYSKILKDYPYFYFLVFLSYFFIFNLWLLTALIILKFLILSSEFIQKFYLPIL